MSNLPRQPGTACCPTRDGLNSAIRRLMAQPATRERSTQYRRLLAQWAATCPREPHCETTAA
ncbi:hypothetical protein B0E38_01858 [Streptomyces sp. 111WW2]|uniref:hypothetical protein n=1 Tax=Streptomyces sp. 111WW2 TaxID=1945515 RepID=UPI000D290AD9|nr:hypothetical protein [Streptomyces sp. 111WW2]PSK58013.1 hypothetical protein B0E38_01858 [Streptomyces sp. 111WW2]